MVKKIFLILLVLGCVFSLSINFASAKVYPDDKLTKNEIYDLLVMYKAIFNGNTNEWDYSKSNDIYVSIEEVNDAYNQIYSNEIQTYSVESEGGGTSSFNKYFDASKTKWINRSDGITLSCYYKAEAIYSSQPNTTMINVQKAFDQLKSKFSSSSNWKNTQSMQAQFHCHATTVGKLKNPWNIEPWRTETNLNKVIAAGCNP